VDRSGVLHDPDDERPSEQAPPAEEPVPTVALRTRQEPW
jgi:hypothetical protein